MLLKLFTFILVLFAFISSPANGQGLVMEEPVYVDNSHIVLYKDNLLNLTVDAITELLVNLVNSLNLGGITVTNKYNNVISGIAIKILNPVNENPILQAIAGMIYVDCTVKNQKFHLLQGQVENSQQLLAERYNSPILRRLLEFRRSSNDRTNYVNSNSRDSFSYSPPSSTTNAFTTIAAGETKPVNLRRVGFTGTSNNQIANALSSVNIALLDTGIDFTHPDLKDSVIDGVNCVTSGASAADDHGHGTNIAGIITANNAGSGIVGAIPGTKVYAVKIADGQGYASLSAELCGLDWVAKNARQYNIKVASMSIGGPGTTDNQCGRTTCDALHRAVCNLTSRNSSPVSLVTSAGNSGTSFEGTVPAAYEEVSTVTSYSDSDGLIGGVGATVCNGNNDDSIAPYSNYATSTSSSMSNHVIMAPGSCIYTTALKSATANNNLYKSVSGTSFSTPHVTAALALCYSDTRQNIGCANLNAIDAQNKLIANSLAYNQANPDYGANNGPAMPAEAYYGPLLHVDTSY